MENKYTPNSDTESGPPEREERKNSKKVSFKKLNRKHVKK